MMLNIPVGISDFAEIRQRGYYYIDKTALVRELLKTTGTKVTLITRPRRFGKTLGMSMLAHFFDIRRDSSRIFEGLDITSEKKLCKEWMNQYPTIFLTFKDIDGLNFLAARRMLQNRIADLYNEHSYLAKSDKVNDNDRKIFAELSDIVEGRPTEDLLKTSISTLMKMMAAYYDKSVIVILDEYDVPLENAHFQGFYDEMSALIRSLFESALKTNENLEFAVITGCLRISKESILTGLNNLGIISILSAAYDEYFGFTQEEVDRMLEFYGITRNRENIKKWYDGYLFGQVEVYNPWSVVNYVEACNHNPEALPLPYWSNTSSNSIVRSLVERADSGVRQEIEALIEGKTILKPIHEDITYEDIDSSQDNLWNFLFFTGYLKKICEKQEEEIRYIEMAIPNSEVRYIYKTTVLRWFEEKIEKKDLSLLYKSVLEGNEEETEKILSDNLMETISFYDYQESFYHGFLVGMFKNIENYIVLSNRESGNGRPDILLKYPSVRGKAIIIELKVAKTFRTMQEKCEEALKQIEKQRYEEALREEGYSDIIKYGIAFYRKECMVRKGC